MYRKKVYVFSWIKFSLHFQYDKTNYGMIVRELSLRNRICLQWINLYISLTTMPFYILILFYEKLYIIIIFCCSCVCIYKTIRVYWSIIQDLWKSLKFRVKKWSNRKIQMNVVLLWNFIIMPFCWRLLENGTKKMEQ